MKNFKYLIIIAVLSTITMTGQNKVSTSKKDVNKTSYLSASLNYISDAVFMGRKDSIAAPYLYPSMTYHHNSGFYGTGSFSFLTASDESRIDLFLVSAGYDFVKNNLTGDFSITKYFFNEESYNVISEVTADLTSNVRYDFGEIINLTIDASIFFNTNSSSDFFLSSEISHDFLTTNQKFQITPSFGVHFGSQNFYEEYYNYNRLGNRSSGKGQGSTVAQTVNNITINESEKFNMMAIDFSLPMWYSHKSLTISFLPTFVLPQSEATIALDETVIKENLEETFYWMAGISYRFGK